MESARPATAADAPRVAELADAARTHTALQRGGSLYLHREARPPTLDHELTVHLDRRYTVVGCVDDVVVGYASAVLETVEGIGVLARIEDLFVEDGARSVGVGEVMMDALLAWCRERGCAGIDAVALPGDRETKNFYERFGLTARAIVVHRRLDGEAPAR